MSGIGKFSAAEIGKRLAQVREPKTQAEIAHRAGWSAAMLSRIEAGERTVTEEELDALVHALGTEEARELSQRVGTEWRFLDRPALDHPDYQILRNAESAIAELAVLADSPDIRGPFAIRIGEYTDELIRLAGRARRLQHRIAFIGPLGEGKTLAICKAIGLEIPDEDGKPQPVLETGAGGTTLCDVHVKLGPKHGIAIEPRPFEDIRADVFDWAEQLTRAHGRTKGESGAPDETRDAVSHELERTLRNMARLVPGKSVKGPDGKRVREDPARELAAGAGSVRDLAVEILGRMDLERRDTRVLWYEPELGASPLDWLRRTFEAINNGRRRDVSLPARIDLMVPDPDLMKFGDVMVSIVDTRGIDKTVGRPDIEAHLTEPHTVSILCSRFNDAPTQAVQQLLDRAREADNPRIKINIGLLVLPHPGEAMAMKDEAGSLVENPAEGYDLKGEQVTNALGTYGLEDIEPFFFNSLEDEPGELRQYLESRVTATRTEFRRELQEVIANAGTLLANADDDQIREEQEQAGKLVQSWIRQRRAPTLATEQTVHEALIGAVTSTHAGSVHAAVRRDGEWRNLSYSHQLGFGTRRLAANTFRENVESFKSRCDTLSEAYDGASEVLAQASRLMTDSYESLLSKARGAGIALYGAELKNAAHMWQECEGEWGRGVRYRQRVADHNSKWFDEPNVVEVEQALRDSLVREWERLLDRVQAIFEYQPAGSPQDEQPSDAAPAEVA